MLLALPLRFPYTVWTIKDGKSLGAEYQTGRTADKARVGEAGVL